MQTDARGAASTPPDERQFLLGFGLTKYETDAYLALLGQGIADAKSLSRLSGVPTSKIYETMARLEGLGLIEVQATRPRKFMARELGEALEGLKELKRREFEGLVKSLPALEGRLRARARTPQRDSAFWSVAVSWRDFAAKHLARAAEAKREYVVYIDLSGHFGSLLAVMRGLGEAPREFEGAVEQLTGMITAIRRNLTSKSIPFRILVGAGPGDEEAARAWIASLARPEMFGRFRLAEPGRPQFHIIDRESVILILANPARPAEGLGSVYVQDPTLAREISKSFDELWERARPIVAEAAKARRGK
ncbi:MAG TPA: helix-turn-helix domain-containing protein [Candidatus Thermoplasmatota archaeon]|nr:helix-turn-helix domain-containing protein [Candidatus Thermoplasmatota archaeon]